MGTTEGTAGRQPRGEPRGDRGAPGQALSVAGTSRVSGCAGNPASLRGGPVCTSVAVTAL